MNTIYNCTGTYSQCDYILSFLYRTSIVIYKLTITDDVWLRGLRFNYRQLLRFVLYIFTHFVGSVGNVRAAEPCFPSSNAAIRFLLGIQNKIFNLSYKTTQLNWLEARFFAKFRHFVKMLNSMAICRGLISTCHNMHILYAIGQIFIVVYSQMLSK